MCNCPPSAAEVIRVWANGLTETVKLLVALKLVVPLSATFTHMTAKTKLFLMIFLVKAQKTA
jgi:hypothetical protein